MRHRALDDGQALSGCETTGFPDIQRYGSEGHPEAGRHTTTALPMAGQPRDCGPRSAGTWSCCAAT
ncbi:hypothetical protein [Streptomyces sp. NPDC056323]|uniref:hypothetical protein n=1 Tax=Streptomyces sp. NPDC056323 TaxID=3345784 RepID=UPI0035DC9A87